MSCYLHHDTKTNPQPCQAEQTGQTQETTLPLQDPIIPFTLDPGKKASVPFTKALLATNTAGKKQHSTLTPWNSRRSMNSYTAQQIQALPLRPNPALVLRVIASPRRRRRWLVMNLGVGHSKSVQCYPEDLAGNGNVSNIPYVLHPLLRPITASALSSYCHSCMHVSFLVCLGGMDMRSIFPYNKNNTSLKNIAMVNMENE